MSERSPSPQRAAYLRAQRRRRRLVLALQILLLVVFLGWWELSARLGWVDAFIVSSPSRVVHTLVGLQASGELWLHIGTSCLEVVVGFVLGTLLGTLIAIGLWWSELLSRVLDPYLVVLNALPKTALGPVVPPTEILSETPFLKSFLTAVPSFAERDSVAANSKTNAHATFCI